MPKRTMLWANTPLIRMLDGGKLCKADHGDGDSGVRTYRDKKGRKRVVGSKKLKKSQWPGLSRSCTCSACLLWLHVLKPHTHGPVATGDIRSSFAAKS